jgi:hypothetical protein
MDVGQIALDSSMAVMARQMQTTTEMQLAVMKKIMESQQEMVEILTAAGVGTNVSTFA